MTTPLPVSVVIPAYNRGHTVARAVRSALEQEPNPPAEVIVVDDCSSDDTAAVARAAGATVLQLPVNQGEGGARNAGIAHSNHDWVALLDSDDEWLPWHLDTLWSRRAGHVLVAGSVITSAGRRVEGNPGRRVRHLRGPLDVVWPANPVFPSAALLHRPAFDAAGGFQSLPLCDDLDTWIRVLEHGVGAVSLQVSVIYHEHVGQLSTDRTGMRAAESAIYDSYRDRAWWSATTQRHLLTKDHWDRLRADTAGRPSSLLDSRVLWFIVPGRAWSLLALLTFRKRTRRRGARVGLDGRQLSALPFLKRIKSPRGER